MARMLRALAHHRRTSSADVLLFCRVSRLRRVEVILSGTVWHQPRTITTKAFGCSRFRTQVGPWAIQDRPQINPRYTPDGRLSDPQYRPQVDPGSQIDHRSTLERPQIDQSHRVRRANGGRRHVGSGDPMGSSHMGCGDTVSCGDPLGCGDPMSRGEPMGSRDSMSGSDPMCDGGPMGCSDGLQPCK